jgi:sec-independent protein translocase protein TatB
VFGIGETELFMIVLFGFLLFGPDKLPGMGRTIGKALRQFRQAQEGFTEVVQSEVMDPFSNAVNEGMGDDSKSKNAAAKRAAAMDEDSDLESADGAPQDRKRETFAQRKARLEAEKAKRDAEAAPKSQPDATAQTADADSDDDVPEPKAAASSPLPEEEPKVASAASLYAMRPKRHEAEAKADADADTDADAGADTDADADAADEATAGEQTATQDDAEPSADGASKEED